MKRKRIPLFDLHLSRRTIKRVSDCLKSGWLSTGPVSAELEQKLGRLIKAKHIVAVSSATAGLELTLRAIGVERGTEVITTPLTFVATVEAILRLGARPVLADVDPRTLTIDPDRVAQKITGRTRVILPVDLAGHPANYRALRRLGNTHGIPILADAAHSLGATCRGKTTAQLADVAVYSFHATKNLTTGEGGLVTGRSKKLIDTVRLTSRHGMTSNAHRRRKSGDWHYDVTTLGAKANLPDILAAIGLGQLVTFAKDQAGRERIAQRYMKSLASLSELCELPHISDGCCHAWYLFNLRLNLPRLRISRDAFIRRMSDMGVECGVHYRPIFELQYYKNQGFDGNDLPEAKLAGLQLVSLPMFPTLPLSDVDYICSCVGDILSKHSR